MNYTRFNIPRDPVNPEKHLDSGYEGYTFEDEKGFYIPSCEIEDVDRAVVKLFESDIGFAANTVNTNVGGKNKTLQINKPFVILATGERFALVKRLRPPRDHQQMLLLPAISIRRTNIVQNSEDIVGRGMNQYTGTLVIKTRLAQEDINYQNAINKLGLQNISTKPDSKREKGEFNSQVSEETRQGALLQPHIGNNIFEIIVIPQPQFYTITYEVVFWTNFMQHMNYMISTLFASFLPQGKMFRLNTEKGYWFMAYVDDELSRENIDDFVDQERIVRYSFTMQVKAFLLAPNGPGNPVPIRRYISAPEIKFELEETNTQIVSDYQVKEDSNILSDFEQNPKESLPKTSNQHYLVYKEITNPNGTKQIKYVKITERNQKTGETAYTTSGVKSIEDLIILTKR